MSSLDNYNGILVDEGCTLNVIRHLSSADIKSVAANTGNSWPTAKSSIERLLEHGLILQLEGLNAKTFTINSQYGIFMGISLDATKIDFVLTDFKFSPINIQTDERFRSFLSQIESLSNLNITETHFTYTPTNDYLEFFEINSICSLVVEKVLDFIEQLNNRINLISIGISLPGIIDKSSDEIIFCPNIPSLVGMPTNKIIKSNLIDRTISNKILLSFCHDNVAALVYEKENSFDIALPQNKLGNDIVFLFQEFGLGISYILNNQLVSGSTGAFGELGHVDMDYLDIPYRNQKEEDDFNTYFGIENIKLESNPCACGNKTCLEKLIRVKVFNSNSVKDFNSKVKKIDSFKNDHPYRYRVLLRLIGRAVNIIVNVLNVDTIIISNHVLGRINGFKEDLESYMNSISLTFSSRNCKIIVGSKLAESTAIGASMMSYYQIINDNNPKATICWD